MGAPAANSNRRGCGKRTRKGTNTAPTTSQFRMTKAKSMDIVCTHWVARRPCNGFGVKKPKTVSDVSVSKVSTSCKRNVPTDCGGFLPAPRKAERPPGMRRSHSADGDFFACGLNERDDTATPSRLSEFASTLPLKPSYSLR